MAFQISAFTPSCINSISLVTDEPPLHDVRLAVVITHFNRQKYVLKTVKSLSEALVHLKDQLCVFVVDNSNNLPAEAKKYAEVIPNANFGGSGGFTRGLLEAQRRGVTHVLFMDDDGNLEPESIERTLHIFEYAKPDKADKLAIAGTLLKEDMPGVINERGALFKKCTVHTNYGGLNMFDIDQILLAEETPVECNYGAWCYFAFPLKGVSHLPFPFFVRGDDILFGLQNKFDIKGTVGIGCWIPSFSEKESPQTVYLGNRSAATINFFTENSCKAALNLLRLQFFAKLNGYLYSSAKAVLMAFEDVFTKKDLYTGDLTGARFRSAIKEKCPGEKPDIVPSNPFELVFSKGRKERRLRRVMRRLTCNGLFIPQFFYKKKTLNLIKDFSADEKTVFLRRKIFYYYPRLHKGFLAKKSFAKGVALLFEYLKLRLTVRKNFNEFSKYYRELKIDREFWERNFAEHMPKTAPEPEKH